jgi:hypothetical protein
MAPILPLSCARGQGTKRAIVWRRGVCGQLDRSIGFGDNIAAAVGV